MTTRPYARAGRRLAVAIGLVALVSAVTACGSSSSSGSSATGGGASSAPAGEPILIGVVGSYSGPYANAQAAARPSIQAWASAVNAAGGINGRPVKLFIEDDNGVAATSLAAVKKLVDGDHVVAIVGQQSLFDSAWAAYVTEKGIPVVGGNANDLSFLKNANFFSVGGNLVSNYYGLMAAAKEKGSKTAVIYCAELASCASSSTILKSVGAPLGVEVSFATGVAASAPDYTAACASMKSAGVQSYILSLAVNVIPRVVDRCKELGLTATQLEPSILNQTFADSRYDGLQGVENLMPFFVDSTPATKAFHDALAKYAPTVGQPDGPPLNSGAITAWSSGKLFEAAVKASGSTQITSDSIKKGLYALKGETLGGLTQPLPFTPGKPNPHPCYFTYVVAGGKFTTPGGLEPRCAPQELIDSVASKF